MKANFKKSVTVWHCLALKQFYIKNVGTAKIQRVQQKIPGAGPMSSKMKTNFKKSGFTEGIFDLDPNSRTRGHSKKIKKKFCKINLRKFSFTNKIVDLWNTLPQSVIDAKDVRQFEIRLK